jgi:hypothetical protein
MSSPNCPELLFGKKKAAQKVLFQNISTIFTSLKNDRMLQRIWNSLSFILIPFSFLCISGYVFYFRSFLFFSMLLSLGLGSQIGILEGMIGPLFDIPSLKNVKKPVITGEQFWESLKTKCKKRMADKSKERIVYSRNKFSILNIKYVVSNILVFVSG